MPGASLSHHAEGAVLRVPCPQAIKLAVEEAVAAKEKSMLAERKRLMDAKQAQHCMRPCTAACTATGGVMGHTVAGAHGACCCIAQCL